MNKMVFKSFSGSSVNYEPIRRANNTRDNYHSQPRVEGRLVSLVGNAKDSKPSNRRKDENVERLNKIDDDILGYNLDGKICLMRTKKNDRNFDCYLSLPFTKGVTERITGRTLLILGSSAHHGEAMLGQFLGVLWEPNLITEVKKYGDTIRWANIGDTKSGFIGLDFNSAARKDDGVATSLEDVKFLAKNLLEFGYDSNKRLFLLKPPYIVESNYGKKLRSRGYNNLKDYATHIKSENLLFTTP
jgi:hypothetical protein